MPKNAVGVPRRSPRWKFWTWRLHWQILLGLVAGALVGWVLALWAMRVAVVANISPFQVLVENPVRLTLDTGGKMFLNSLKVIVIPLVTSSIIMSVSTIGRRHGFARMGVKTLVYYLTTSTIAILIGLGLVNLIKPGSTDDEKPLLDAETLAQFESDFAEESKKLQASAELDRERSGTTLWAKILSVFQRLIPPNPVQAMVEMDLLGLIVLSLLVGYFLSYLAPERLSVMQTFWQGVYDISFSVTELVLKFAPLGVGMLLAATVSENYVILAGDNRVGQFVSALTWFAIVSGGALLIHLLIVLPLVLIIAARVNPFRHFKAMMPALLTAFSTSSSNATLSVSLDCVETRAGVSRETASFVVPLGATVNMDGTALYECVAAIFVIQLFGLDAQLDFADQFMIVLIALLTSVGVAGVPSASLVAIIIILDSMTRQLNAGIDLAKGLAVLMILDRPLDMMRTAVNVFSDSCGAVVISKSEGESPLSAPIRK